MTQQYGIAPGLALHQLGWADHPLDPLPCLLLSRMAEYAAFAQAHRTYQAAQRISDTAHRREAMSRFQTDDPMAADYLRLVQSRDGRARLRALLAGEA